MILIIDNYDSFTFNLVQLIKDQEADIPVSVIRNDELPLREIARLDPVGLIISPGPGRPDNAGVSLPAITEFAGSIPILGVCLGHQCIAQAFGARIISAKTLRHGKTSEIFHDGDGIFAGLESPMIATRYHSLALDPNSLPSCLTVSAWTSDGEIMGIRHRRFPLSGLQFHPESFLTPQGSRLMANFLWTVQLSVAQIQARCPIHSTDAPNPVLH